MIDSRRFPLRGGAGTRCFRALCCDYDDTLARNGIVPDVVRTALRRAAAAGVRLILATGREIEELEAIFPHYHLFERIVAENGAMLVTPSTRRCRRLATPPPGAFIDLLSRRGVSPLAVGHVIVATRSPHEATVRAAIAQLDLKYQVITNKGAVMVLPNGINKASGLIAALDEMELPLEDVIGVGDAENDCAFLEMCGMSVAVANALPQLKQLADIVTTGERGSGVIEIIDDILAWPGSPLVSCVAQA